MAWSRETGCSTHYFSLIVVQHPITRKYLAVEETRKRGWWLPGGFCECGDDHYSTAHKETLEEGGLEIDLKGVLRVESSINKYGARQRVIFYAHPKDPSALPKQRPGDEESVSAAWMTLQEMKKKALEPVPQGWRSEELLGWATYLEDGGAIYPLQVLQKESSDVPSPVTSYMKEEENITQRWFHFAQEGNVKEMKKLLEVDRSLLDRRNNPKKWTAACFAARFLSLPLMEFLIEEGCDIHASTHKKRTPLHLVSQFDSQPARQIALLLVSQGACSLIYDSGNRTVFDFACKKILDILKEKDPIGYEVWEKRKN